MKLLSGLLLFLSLQSLYAQDIIKLYDGVAPGSENATWKEQVSTQNMFNTEVIYNVTEPSLMAYLPPKHLTTGTAVIIAPGGAFHTLSINSEGIDVAKWLNSKGITAFVLKYRLLPENESALPNENGDNQNTSSAMTKKMAMVLDLATADGLNAMDYVRSNAKSLGIDPNKIGFMGFSAGGSVTMGVTFNYVKSNRPDFIVPVYPWMTVLGPYSVPHDAPPMLIICASDDQYDLAHESIDLYSAWSKSGMNAALHMYSKGGHGFGMKTQNLPSDNWISRFYEWSVAEGIVVPRHQP